ncbi:12855_t:CDS:2, partial [Funneliformis mosseae]
SQNACAIKSYKDSLWSLVVKFEGIKKRKGGQIDNPTHPSIIQ